MKTEELATELRDMSSTESDRGFDVLQAAADRLVALQRVADAAKAYAECRGTDIAARLVELRIAIKALEE